jgi:hypothetical protein
MKMANITLEAVEAVMEQANVEFPAAKEALVQADGNVEQAVRALTGEPEEETVKDAEYTADPDKDPVDEIIEKLKKLVKSGNVDRIVVRRGDDVLLNIPVNVGLVGSVIGLAAAPWAVIAAAVAAFGFSCKVEIIKKDGTKEEVE